MSTSGAPSYARMTREISNHGIGRTCPRCKTFTVIFSGVGLDGLHLLPVKGKFQYPCRKCAWSMECDTKLLEEFPPEKPPLKKR